MPALVAELDTPRQAVSVANLGTGISPAQDNVSNMATPKKPKVFVREWRVHLGRSGPELADALGIERESLLKKERENRWPTGQAVKAAKFLGITVNQLTSPPPPPGTIEQISLDDAIKDQPESVKKLITATVLTILAQQ